MESELLALSMKDFEQLVGSNILGDERLVAAFVIYRVSLCPSKLQRHGFIAAVAVPGPRVSTAAVRFATTLVHDAQHKDV
jgi:hypothetical protein